MTSGFSGGGPGDFSAGGRSSSSSCDANFNTPPPQLQFPIPPDSFAQIRRTDFTGKRSLAEFQQQNPSGLGFYPRNVKARLNYTYLHTSSPISPLSPVDLSPGPSVSNSVNSRYGIPIHHQSLVQRSPGNLGMEKKMMNKRLQELERVLLGDDDEKEEEEAISAVSNSELSDTIQDLICPVLARQPVSPSPASSSSSCSSTSASPPTPCVKQSFIDAAATISDGKLESAVEIITRLQQIANQRGTPEQRLTAYMVSAFKSRVNPTVNPPPRSELYTEEQTLAIQMLYEVSPCLKLGFMAANLAILEAASEHGFRRIHVLDFNIGQGRQYVDLLHALASQNFAGKRAVALKLTVFGEEKNKVIGEALKTLATEIGVRFDFSVKKSNINDVDPQKLEILPDETLAVNLPFRLHKLPDESVTTENLRDYLLRRVKGLSPAVVTVVEQDMNANTAPLTVRVRECYEHYGALFDSLEAMVSRDNSDRIRIELALGRRIGNSLACEGQDRVERCEVFGKWRARMSMAGFEQRIISRTIAESLRVKLNSGARGNSGFTVNEISGGVGFGWMGRILTVASAWR